MVPSFMVLERGSRDGEDAGITNAGADLRWWFRWRLGGGQSRRKTVMPFTVPLISMRRLTF